MIRILVRLVAKVVILLAYWSYKAEGVNALLLFMPAKLVAPTLRKYGAIIGSDAQIHTPLIIHNASPEPGRHYANLVIGEHCYLGRDVFLDLREKIILEDYVTISMRCTLLTHTDVGMRPADLLNLPPSSAPIRLKRGAYLGASVTVLEGVTIGEKATVGAGSVVICNVPDGATVGGVPAKPLHVRDNNEAPCPIQVRTLD